MHHSILAYNRSFESKILVKLFVFSFSYNLLSFLTQTALDDKCFSLVCFSLLHIFSI